MSGGSDVGSRVMEVGDSQGRVHVVGNVPACVPGGGDPERICRLASTLLVGMSCSSSNLCSAPRPAGRSAAEVRAGTRARVFTTSSDWRSPTYIFFKKK